MNQSVRLIKLSSDNAKTQAILKKLLLFEKIVQEFMEGFSKIYLGNRLINKDEYSVFVCHSGTSHYTKQTGITFQFTEVHVCFKHFHRPTIVLEQVEFHNESIDFIVHSHQPGIFENIARIPFEKAKFLYQDSVYSIEQNVFNPKKGNPLYLSTWEKDYYFSPANTEPEDAEMCKYMCILYNCVTLKKINNRHPIAMCNCASIRYGKV